MALEIITQIYEHLAIDILGNPLLFGLTALAVCGLILFVSGIPKWALMAYLTPIILGLCAPGYHPILLPEWVFYIVLIFLGVLWGTLIIKIKG